jgi:hypothetical protein
VPLIAVILSGCGGGSGVSGAPPVQPTTAPVSTPTPAPTPTPNPSVAGDAFAYTGSLTQTVTYYATPPPDPVEWGGATPLPTSTPWVSTTKQTVTQNVSVSTGQSFGGNSNLTDLATKETDTGQLQTTSVTSQNYFSYAADSSRANGVDVTEIGMSSTDSNGVALQSVLGSGNGIVEKLPFVYGGQWTNTATRTDTENDPSGEAITANYASDGTYQEQFTYPEGGTASAVTRDDGSAVYSVPLLGSTGGNSGFTVEPPAGGQIAFAFSIASTAQAFDVTDWYPTAPPNFASDTYVDEGSTTLPSSCNVGSAYQSAGVEEFVETKGRLDPLFGEYETDQVTQYASSTYGLLCETVNDDLKEYYNFSGQGGALLAFTFTTPASPVVETTVSETLALQSAQYASTSSTRRAGASSVHPVVSQAILPQPSLARARMILAAAHARTARALATAARSGAARRQTP